MGIDITCNSCNMAIERGEEVFCGGCVEEKDDKIAQLEKENSELEEELSICKETIEDYEKEKGE